MRAFCHIYAQWDQVGERVSGEANHLLDLGLTCDTTFDLRSGEKHQEVLRMIANAGGLCSPNLYPAFLDSNLRDANWWKYPEAQCQELLAVAGEKYAPLGLGPMRAINTYTAGNSLVAACRRAGVRYILGFCAPTVIEDGGWEIAHYGSPLSPYFISDEDFRKPEAGERDDAVMMSSMELRNPMVCLNHWSEGPWCPLNALAADRWLEPSADPLPFLQIAEDWLRQSELSGEPLFFHINLQYFFAGRCYEHNRRALEWLAEQRDKGRLEVGGLQSWRKRLKEQNGFARQTTYWRGEMMGFHVGHRPGCYPDVIVDESLRGQFVWEYPQALPVRHYDYRRKWEFPAFQPDGTAPSSAIYRSEDACITRKDTAPNERIFEIAVQENTPVLLWEAFAGWQAPFAVEILGGKASTRMVPHPAGADGALLVEAEGLCSVRVTGHPVDSVFHKSWGGLVSAQTFFRDHRPYTILAAQTPEPFVVEARISVPGEEPIRIESLQGIDYRDSTLAGNRLPLAFDGTRLACWYRIWGVNSKQIELSGVEETEERLRRETLAKSANLEPDAPGYQSFGNIRNTQRWDRRLARFAGDREMERINSWFADERPGVGEAVIEAHPGIYLPRGSITKVLGHEFDVVRCQDGYGFREICVDYPQGWDWGVAAWVQWRHLKVRLEGLRPAGSYILHLHACDPEGRDIAQRVHFFNPEATEPAPLFGYIPIHRQAELCGVSEWCLPKGIEARWQPEALCSVEIPKTCLHWPAVGVWIVPLEKCKLYDWVTEKGAPGLLSHLWVTRLS